jgi:hypothetical protein
MVRKRREDVGTTTRFAKLVLVALFSASCGSSTPSPAPTPTLPLSAAPRAATTPPSSAPVAPGPPAPEFPKTVALDAFGEGDRIADLTALGVGDHVVLAWVTYFDEVSAALRSSKKKGSRPAPKGPAATADAGKQGASVVVRALDKDGEAVSPPKVVSSKAVSFGGVALARTAQGDVGLAWVGKDAALGQVFVTKLSDTGDKLAQKMITHSKTGCSDVALAPVPDGFVVAWVESNADRTEIFAAKVGKDLARVGAERRVAATKGETSDIRLTNRGDELFLVWSESRDVDGGIGVARLSTADLTVRGDPAVILAAPGHARGIDLSRFGDGVQLAWVEDAPPATHDAGAAARALVAARLDASARSTSGRTALPVAADPSSVALDCDRVCRVVVPVAEAGELSIYGFSFDGSQPPSAPRRLAALSGVSTEDTSPVIVKDWLFFAEDNLRGGGRIRKAKLAW